MLSCFSKTQQMALERSTGDEKTLVCPLENPILGQPALPDALFGAFSHAELAQASCLGGRTDTTVSLSPPKPTAWQRW